VPTALRTFDGQIKVASRIVDYLSSGLYRTPAACLKELVNNSYDADARLASLFVKPDADRIIIEDDGDGMDQKEFQRHFDRVSQSFKRDSDGATASGRPKIGKIGIGFIAANELCDTMEIFSTKRSSSELMHVSIHFADMRRDARERMANGDSVTKGDYTGEILAARPTDHYTRIFLKDIKDGAKPILASARRQHGEKAQASLYGRSPRSVYNILTTERLDSWQELDEYSETLLNVALNVPVRYLPDWMPDGGMPIVRPFEEAADSLGFALKFDGSDVRKPIAFRAAERYLVDKFEFVGKQVSASGYFYAQRKVLKPQNLNGLLVRIRQAAVGEYDPTFWGYPPDKNAIFQGWVSAELWANDQLEDALNIDRRTLRAVHPSYVELRDAIHKYLDAFFTRVRKELYAEPARERNTKRTRSQIVELSKALADSTAIGSATRRRVISDWKAAETDTKGVRRLLRRYSVSELYEIVLDVARDVLDRRDAERFIQALSERMQRK